jgi:UDP-N-acetylmuramate dehydrogenase
MRSPEPLVPLAPMTTLGVGGVARWFVEASGVDDVLAADTWARQRGLTTTILAGGSNVVVADGILEQLVVRVAWHGVTARLDQGDTLLTAAAGEPWDPVVARSVEAGLAGLECLSGIPGTVGGTPVQNVGAYGQDVSAVIDAVTAIDRQSGERTTLSAEQCGFAYRHSRFKGVDAGRFVIGDVTLRLRPGPPTLTYPELARDVRGRSGSRTPGIREVREAVLALRARKGMLLDASDSDTRSVGSFFTNPVVSGDDVARVAQVAGARPPTFPAGGSGLKVPAAWLLERAGCTRGFGVGPVGLSGKHTLAVVNRGGATAAEVVAFAAEVKRRVWARFGVQLLPEPTFIGFDGDPAVAYLLDVRDDG